MTIEEAISKYHFIKRGEDGTLELYLDHHSLQSFRQCESYFELSILNNIRPKGKSWSLSFGIVFHKMIEDFYREKMAGTFDLISWITSGLEIWETAKLDQFKAHKTYENLGGKAGFLALLAQYGDHYSRELEKLRPVGIEIAFGKHKEVPLGEFEVKAFTSQGYTTSMNVRCYLTGRIDFLMDSGNAIGPLDHKTAAFFNKPENSYIPQEGMTGYVYATKHIIKNNFPALLEGRKVDRIWMNFVQVKSEPDLNKRFKRIPIFKTDWELEQYRLRQLRTFQKIYDLMFTNVTADWNTAICNNFFHTECPYRAIHRQNSLESQLVLIQSDYEITPPWDPENIKD
jgi:hypothetical protein